MDINEMLFSKNGAAALALARLFLNYKIGAKIPTVTELSERLHLSRGTVQSSIRLLTDNQAIKLESKGHMGTYLVNRNMKDLLAFAGIHGLVGVMPLPYSRRYEGLASGLIVAMENQYNIPNSMAYMRGARNRIGMLIANRYDYAVVSKYAADDYLNDKKDIIVAKELGEHSYLSEHVIVFHSPKSKQIEDGMRVGIDNDSIDQKRLTELVVKGKKVTLVPLDYSQILQRAISGDIDAAVWNKDEITDKLVSINYTQIKVDQASDAYAVIVVSAERPEFSSLLSEIIDANTVMEIQRLVLEGKITPSY
ncbi:MAG: GntR family transcriptional regulator [Erysipelotrichia bacterium]|nr:GntR family transcriptional regulator [Erysipelotrichia bacterium]